MLEGFSNCGAQHRLQRTLCLRLSKLRVQISVGLKKALSGSESVENPRKHWACGGRGEVGFAGPEGKIQNYKSVRDKMMGVCYGRGKWMEK